MVLCCQVEYSCTLLLLIDTQNSQKRQFVMPMRTCTHNDNINIIGDYWLQIVSNCIIIRWGKLFIWIKFYMNLSKTRKCGRSKHSWVEGKKLSLDRKIVALQDCFVNWFGHVCKYKVPSTIPSNSLNNS